MTFCTDRKCLRHVCHRHPVHWEKQVPEGIPIALSSFKVCEQRIRSSSEPYEEDVCYESS